MEPAVWQKCLDRLEDELDSSAFNTWIRPLQARGDEVALRLLAPNGVVKRRVEGMYLGRIRELVQGLALDDQGVGVEIDVGSAAEIAAAASEPVPAGGEEERTVLPFRRQARNQLNPGYTFGTFVEGKSNQFPRAAAQGVADNAGRKYNPLLLYGGVGLGKTHLMQAVGNELLRRDPSATVVYQHSQQFVQAMVDAITAGSMQDFVAYYRSVDVLLIDDIQFFGNKARSQDEFFHVFNAMVEQGRQMVLTCDRYPSEIQGLEERLVSRFVSGLTAEMEPPELEHRVAILMKKADLEGVALSQDVAFFIAENVRSNVRELEGAYKRVVANAQFTGRPITKEQVAITLRDLIALCDRQVGIENIQRTVAEYNKIRVSDLLSKRRNRAVARPRQMAMALSKELTNHSLPEIGDAFGGRDHTTVLHACRKIAELRKTSTEVEEDYKNLRRLLTR